MRWTGCLAVIGAIWGLGWLWFHLHRWLPAPKSWAVELRHPEDVTFASVSARPTLVRNFLSQSRLNNWTAQQLARDFGNESILVELSGDCGWQFRRTWGELEEWWMESDDEDEDDDDDEDDGEDDGGWNDEKWPERRRLTLGEFVQEISAEIIQPTLPRADEGSTRQCESENENERVCATRDDPEVCHYYMKSEDEWQFLDDLHIREEAEMEVLGRLGFKPWLLDWTMGLYSLAVSVFIGPEGATTELHSDSDETGFLVVIEGKKTVAVAFPSAAQHLLMKRFRADFSSWPVEWSDLDFWGKECQDSVAAGIAAPSSRPRDPAPMNFSCAPEVHFEVFDLWPGDLLSIPGYWVHTVKNTAGVAVALNMHVYSPASFFFEDVPGAVAALWRRLVVWLWLW